MSGEIPEMAENQYGVLFFNDPLKKMMGYDLGMDWICLILAEQGCFGAERIALERRFASVALLGWALAFFLCGGLSFGVAAVLLVAFVIRGRAGMCAAVWRAAIAADDVARRVARSLSRCAVIDAANCEFSALRRGMLANLGVAERINDLVLLIAVGLYLHVLPLPRALRRGALLR